MSDLPSPFANLNQLPAREAMGLPPDLVRRTRQTLLAGDADLRLRSLQELARIAEQPTEPFARRLGAGCLLALLGDPRVRTTDPVMVTLPGGVVSQGLDAAGVDKVLERWGSVGVQRAWIVKECPRRNVTVQPFRIAKYAVTNREYVEYLEETRASSLPTSWRFGAYPAHLSNHPVWTVAPKAADAYAAWLSGRTGRRFRLPTEAEWEYAAGGPDGNEYPWGESFDARRANTVEAGPLQTTPIGIYPEGASPFGLLDMAGNVEEFVADCYAPYPGGETVDDDLAQHGSYRVARGGSFTRHGDLARCRRRHGWYRGELYAIGFRLAEDI